MYYPQGYQQRKRSYQFGNSYHTTQRNDYNPNHYTDRRRKSYAWTYDDYYDEDHNPETFDQEGQSSAGYNNFSVFTESKDTPHTRDGSYQQKSRQVNYESARVNYQQKSYNFLKCDDALYQTVSREQSKIQQNKYLSKINEQDFKNNFEEYLRKELQLSDNPWIMIVIKQLVPQYDENKDKLIFEFALEDVKETCFQFGHITEVKILDFPNGHIAYVKYKNYIDAYIAMMNLNDKLFNKDSLKLNCYFAQSKELHDKLKEYLTKHSIDINKEVKKQESIKQGSKTLTNENWTVPEPDCCQTYYTDGFVKEIKYTQYQIQQDKNLKHDYQEFLNIFTPLARFNQSYKNYPLQCILYMQADLYQSIQSRKNNDYDLQFFFASKLIGKDGCKLKEIRYNTCQEFNISDQQIRLHVKQSDPFNQQPSENPSFEPVSIFIGCQERQHFNYVIKQVQDLIIEVFNYYAQWCYDKQITPAVKRVFLKPFFKPESLKKIQHDYELSITKISEIINSRHQQSTTFNTEDQSTMDLLNSSFPAQQQQYQPTMSFQEQFAEIYRNWSQNNSMYIDNSYQENGGGSYYYEEETPYDNTNMQVQNHSFHDYSNNNFNNQTDYAQGYHNGDITHNNGVFISFNNYNNNVTSTMMPQQMDGQPIYYDNQHLYNNYQTYQ